MLTSLHQSASDRAAAYTYDARGYLRYTIDASGHPTGYAYDGAGRVIRTTDYAGWIAGAASYPLAYVEAQLAATGLSTNSYNRITPLGLRRRRPADVRDRRRRRGYRVRL